MEKGYLITLLEDILNDRGVPKNIKTSIEQSITLLDQGKQSEEEKLSYLVSILDDASGNPNLSAYTRTHIWNIVSFLESMKMENR